MSTIEKKTIKCRIRKAARPHVCVICGGWIRKGEQYTVRTMVDEESLRTAHIHINCASKVDWVESGF